MRGAAASAPGLLYPTARPCLTRTERIDPGRETPCEPSALHERCLQPLPARPWHSAQATATASSKFCGPSGDKAVAGRDHWSTPRASRAQTTAETRQFLRACCLMGNDNTAMSGLAIASRQPIASARHTSKPMSLRIHLRHLLCNQFVALPTPPALLEYSPTTRLSLPHQLCSRRCQTWRLPCRQSCHPCQKRTIFCSLTCALQNWLNSYWIKKQ